MRERNQKFLAEYFHDGSWWGLEFYAADFEDAEVICRAHSLKLLGAHQFTIPVVGGNWLANLIMRVRNGIQAEPKH